ncbi:MAG: hypothetical protein QOG78_2839, partial [Rhodospirillaceae bacterium]|nr:hypothetical protein [Rhodospirillaceae bacterium]
MRNSRDMMTNDSTAAGGENAGHPATPDQGPHRHGAGDSARQRLLDAGVHL